MQVFLSYAAQDRPAAEAVRLALAGAGHDVFFDREDLPPGEEYDQRIRRAIESADLVVFLLTPDAVDAGSYTLTELDIARSTWPHPAGRVLPVMLRSVPFEQIPAYLKSITILQPAGNPAADIAAAVQRIERQRVRRKLAMTALGLAGAAAAAAVALFAWHARGPSPAITGRDGAVAVLVPAGTFVMGDDEESPRRELWLDAYYIDQHEVTVGHYARFLESSGGVNPPDEWESVDPQRHGGLPVVGVDWSDAAAYCKWAGRRFPTEAEWEKAARGTDQRRYPWGNEAPTPDRANFSNASPQTYDGGLAAAGAHPQGRSPYNVHDLAGNAAEWVADWHADSFTHADARNPKGPDSGTARVIRGGGRFDPADRITATRRFHASPDTRSPDIGFRCARDEG